MSDVRTDLEHNDPDCTGKWQEHTIRSGGKGRANIRAFRCTLCNTFVENNDATRKRYYTLQRAESYAEEANKRAAIREILRAAHKADKLFEVAIALGELLGNTFAYRGEMEMIRQEYDRLSASGWKA